MRSVLCIVIAAGAVLGLSGQGFAQKRAEKPSPYTEKASPYTTTPPTPLDKNYGLPALALPGYEAPRPKAVTPGPNGTADQANGTADLDFYKPTPESRFTLPRQTTAREGYSTTETPLYTTQEGMPDGDGMRTDTMQPYPLGSDSLGGYPRRGNEAGARRQGRASRYGGP